MFHRFPKVTLLIFAGSLAGATSAFAAVNIADKDGWKVNLGGFVEVDAIHDSTRSLGEIPQNSPVDRPDNIKNMTGRTQFSIRNSRFSIGVEAPEMEGWKSRGYLEMDFMGFDPAPGSTTASANNTEASFFNNPTLRARHAFLSTENDGGWQFLAGQTWTLFGWQPYYFMPTAEVAPVTGMIYARTTQFRAMKTMSGSDGMTVQAAVTVGRPPQRDASMPDIEAGLRLASTSRTGGFTGGATGGQKAQPMSIGVTGAYRQFQVAQAPTAPTGLSTQFGAFAFAGDALIPVIASSDGKDVSNTLTIGGEYTMGKGYGDQLGGWTGNQSNPLSNNSSASSADSKINLDAGLGGFDANNNFSLIKIQTWNAYLQYHLPAATKTWLSFGYSTLNSSNILNFTTNGSTKFTNGNTAYRKDENYFGNVMHDISSQIRVGFEYAYKVTTYADEVKGSNDRYQLNSYFLF
ncbi:MAG: hypothetical protein ACXWR1_15435 [Bdellovibrionota bacterium]